MSDTLPAWAMEQAREALFETSPEGPTLRDDFIGFVARALVAADKAATERAAMIAETLIPNGKGKAQSVAHAAGHHIAAAIRNQEPQ